MMHIHSRKEITKNKKIVALDDPDLLLIPLSEQFGSKPEPVVSPGDKVKKYQLIGRSSKGNPTPIHAPVSGTIEKIKKTPQADGSQAVTIFIRNDRMDTEMDNPLPAIDRDNAQDILRIINEAGIVGMGGAQFPTGKKYDRKDKDVKTFIINGAECEPYLTGDYAMMKEYPREILEGILYADKVLEAEDIVIAFERSNQELEPVFGKYLDDDRYGKIRTFVLPNEYPQGDERLLSKTVTGVVIPSDVIPLEKGIVISNVGTVYAVYNAIRNGKPLIERVITVSGEHAPQPGNYRIKIGTPVSHIIKHCRIDTENSNIVSGGPMMSPHIRDLETPMHKGALGILAIPKDRVDRMNCIWCGYCVDVCPMKLMPMKYEQFVRRGKYEKLEQYNIDVCIDCAACEYICPSNVPLIESIEKGKKKLKEIKDAADKKKT